MLSHPKVASRAPLRVALLSSRRAPGLRYLLEQDPGRGTRYEIVAGVVSTGKSEVPAELAVADVPCAIHDLRSFCSSRGRRLSDLDARCLYDARTVRLLGRFAPDLIVLSGYLHLLTEPMLSAYDGRIVSIHDADLALARTDGGPRYPGLHATLDALQAGEPETRSTVHLVDRDVDTGPPLVRSWGFPAHPLVSDAKSWGATDILKAYAYAQREWMMRAAWGPLLARAIDLFAGDRVRVLDRRAVIRGHFGPEELARDPLPARRAAGY